MGHTRPDYRAANTARYFRKLDQAKRLGGTDAGGPFVDLKQIENLPQMAFYGIRANAEAGGYFCVRGAVGNELQDFDLAWGQNRDAFDFIRFDYIAKI